MGGMVRRVVALLVVAAATVVVTQGPSHGACGCKHTTLEQKVNRADRVFTGTVTMASGPTTSGKKQMMSYDVKVDRSYKSDTDGVEPQLSVKSKGTGADCPPVTLVADTRYLFFVRAVGTELWADPCGGTQPATSAMTQKLVALLGAGDTPQPAVPEDPTLTLVDNAEPPSLARLAAPGAALVLVGLLGLMVFSALGRSRRS